MSHLGDGVLGIAAEAREGDRVFLIQQGKKGPALIGYGELLEVPTAEAGALIMFEHVVSPDVEPIAGLQKLKVIPDSANVWNTQASGVKVPPSIAAAVEELILATEGSRGDRFDSGSLLDADTAVEAGTDNPERKTSSTSRYQRDEEVRRLVRQRANGRCEYCCEPGFITADGMPYLECHHIRALAKDGVDKVSNVIALCARHHREAHHGRNSLQLENEMTERIQAKLRP